MSSSISAPAFLDPRELPTPADKQFFDWLRKMGFTMSKAKKKELEAQGRDVRITHTSLAAQICRHPAVSVPYDQLPLFYKHYEEALQAGARLYIVEKGDRNKPVPLLLDYDLYFEANDTEHPALIDEFKDEVLRRSNELVQQSFRGDPSSNSLRLMYVQEAPITETKKGLKLGMHLMWPDLWVDSDSVLTLRRYLIHGLARTFSVEAMRARWNLLLCESWCSIVDLSVCQNVQIRLPGSRKIGPEKCKCAEKGLAVCHHRTIALETTDEKSKKKVVVERSFVETARLYELASVWEPDGRKIPAMVQALYGDIKKLCMTLTLIREPQPAMSLIYADTDVPDTEDDDIQKRSGRKRMRDAGRKITNAFSNDAERARWTDELKRSGDAELDEKGEISLANKIRETLFSAIAVYFPDDLPSCNPDSYDLRNARYASVIVKELWCENLGGFHGNRGGRISLDAKTGMLSRKCMCKHVEDDERYFGSCADYSKRLQLRARLIKSESKGEWGGEGSDGFRNRSRGSGPG